MGCHTWFYRKVERSIEEARVVALDWLRYNLELWERTVEGDCEVFSEEIIDNMIALFKRQIRMVEKGLCNVAVMNRQENMRLERIDKHFMYLPEHGLYQDVVGEFHDVFRIGGYPETLLFSYEQTVSFIQDNPRIVTTDETYIKLRKFWDKHTNGMIRFG